MIVPREREIRAADGRCLSVLDLERGGDGSCDQLVGGSASRASPTSARASSDRHGERSLPGLKTIFTPDRRRLCYLLGGAPA